MESDWNPLKSAMLVYYWLRLLGLAPVCVKNSKFHPASVPGKLYPIAVAVIYGLAAPGSYLIQLKSGENAGSYLDSGTTISNLHLVMCHVTLAAIPILLLTISKKIVHLLNDLRATSDELRSLGIAEDQGKYLKGIFVSTVSINTLNGLLHVSIVLLKPGRPLFKIIILLIKDLVIPSTVLIFSQVLIYIRQRFKLLNNKLYDGFQDPRVSSRARNTSFANRERIEKLAAFHLNLCDLVDRTARLFSAPILMCILEFFTVLTASSCSTISSIMHLGQLTSAEQYIASIRYKIIGAVLILLVTIVELCILFHVCVTTCNQGNAAKVAIFEVWNKFQLPELKDEFGMFSLQMMHKPVSVSAFGFFDLDYTSLSKIFGAVMAYSIIALQFGLL